MPHPIKAELPDDFSFDDEHEIIDELDDEFEDDDADFEPEAEDQTIGPVLHSCQMDNKTFIGHVIVREGYKWMLSPHILTAQGLREFTILPLHVDFRLDGLVTQPVINPDCLLRQYPDKFLGLATINNIPIACTNTEH